MRKFFASVVTFFVIIGVLIVIKQSNLPRLPGIIPEQKQVNPTQPNLTIDQALNVIDREELKKTLFWLCSNDLEGRMSAKKGNDTAKDYLVQYFQSLGYETSTQEFSVQNLNNFKEQGSGKTANVIAMIPGNDTSVMHETIVMGAHFDHIGYGPSMSQTPNRREIHFGADDNGSGTTALTGAAKALSKMKGKNKRRWVFIAFSAEEMGLIGAKHYVNNPKYPNTVYMINMDMVGRLNGKTTIDALGAASSPEVKEMLPKLTGFPFKPKITGGSGGGSDHAAFYQKGVPICFLHTGQHSDYHTPNDTPEKIDFDGLTWVSKYVARIMWEVDQMKTKPTFAGRAGEEVLFKDHGR